jgi:class 3 adenylate cyclase
VIGAYHTAVSEGIGQYDGFVAKFMGDGVLVYFGYPQAREDDADSTFRSSRRRCRTSAAGCRRRRTTSAKYDRRADLPG